MNGAARAAGLLLGFALAFPAAGCGGDSRGPAQGMLVFSDGAGDDIFAMAPERGARLRRLTRLPGAQLDPSWSPDSRKIVFRDSRRGVNFDDEIAVMDADGSGVHHLTRNPANDCLRIPATSAGAGSRARIGATPGSGRCARTGGDPQPLVHGNSGPLVARREAAGLQLARGRERRRPVRRQCGREPAPPPARDPAARVAGRLVPDGKRILFTRSFNDRSSGVYVVNADGTNVRRLTRARRNDFGASWLPDGSKIVFSSERLGRTHLFVLRADRSHQHAITNAGADDFDPTWV